MRYFWIIFLLLGAWQVIGSLIERASKKQREQRLRELAAQREQQVGPTGAPPHGRAERAEALASRRRAQLEELRRRRAGRQLEMESQPQPQLQAGVGPPVTPASRPPTAPPAQPRPTPFQTSPPRPILRQPPQPPARPQPRPVTPTRTPARTATRLPTERLPTRPTPAARPPIAPPAPPKEKPSEQLVPTAQERPPEPKRHGRLPLVSELEMTPHLLRRMVLLREVLDPPVSIRERDVWERF